MAQSTIKLFASRLDALLCERIYEFKLSVFQSNESAKKQVLNDIENNIIPLFQLIQPKELVTPRLFGMYLLDLRVYLMGLLQSGDITIIFRL